MQTGMKAGLAIVLAVFLTGIVGFVTAVTPEVEERTYYDQISDLTPVVDYTSVESYTDYNPITNVSGWSDKTGVTIHYMPNDGISAYPFRFYTASKTGPTYTGQYQIGGMYGYGNSVLNDDTWVAVPTIYKIPNAASSTTIAKIEVERISSGHITLSTEKTTQIAQQGAYSFMVNFQHLDENDNIVHQFTFQYRGLRTYDDMESDITISSLSEFDSTPSQKIEVKSLRADCNFEISLEINVSLPTGHIITGYICPLVEMFDVPSNGPAAEADSRKWIYLEDGIITKYDSTTQIPNLHYNGGINWQYTPGLYISMTPDRSYPFENNVYIDGAKMNTDVSVWKYMPISQIIYPSGTPSFNEGDTLTVAGHKLYTGQLSHNAEHELGGRPITKVVWNANLSSYADSRISYHNGLWYPSILSDNGLYYVPDLTKQEHSLENIYVVEEGLAPSVSIKQTGVVYDYKYMDANKFVEISAGVKGTWRNYMDRTEGGSGQITTAYYNNGAVQILTAPGTTISTDSAYLVNVDGNKTRGSMSVTIPNSIPYYMALVTLDFQNQEYYAQGIVWDSIPVDERTTNNWTLRPYVYSFTPTFTGIPHATYVQGLSFENKDGTKVFILNTKVQTDPLGRLWGNPTIYLGHYFPDYFDYDNGNTGVPNKAIRMLVNAVITYGDSLTINGQTMSVSNGEVTFDYYTQETQTIPSEKPEEPPTEVTVTVKKKETMPIKGMAVDWEDGHVYLVFTEQGKTRYDLGEYNTTSVNVIVNGEDTNKDTVLTDVVSGTGIWYWQANLYSIYHDFPTVNKLDLSQGLNGWGMSLQVTMLLFAAMLILGVALVHYYYRNSDEQMGIFDWIIIGLAILLSLGVATI